MNDVKQIGKYSRLLKKDEIYFVHGRSTKVKIIESRIKPASNKKGYKARVLILEASIYSIFYNYVGEIVEINENILYPTQKKIVRKYKIKKIDEKNETT